MVYPVFIMTYVNKGIPPEIRNDFIQLSKKLKYTILKMPMKYIGGSVYNDHYSIFKIEDFGNIGISFAECFERDIFGKLIF
jgi:hypothetical protein